MAENQHKWIVRIPNSDYPNDGRQGRKLSSGDDGECPGQLEPAPGAGILAATAPQRSRQHAPHEPAPRRRGRRPRAPPADLPPTPPPPAAGTARISPAAAPRQPPAARRGDGCFRSPRRRRHDHHCQEDVPHQVTTGARVATILTTMGLRLSALPVTSSLTRATILSGKLPEIRVSLRLRDLHHDSPGTPRGLNSGGSSHNKGMNLITLPRSRAMEWLECPK